MKSPITLKSTFGKNYETKEQVKADFDSNEDFIVVDRPFHGFMNKQECLEEGVEHVTINIQGRDGRVDRINIYIGDQLPEETESEVADAPELLNPLGSLQRATHRFKLLLNTFSSWILKNH